jgi:hypothetical protein
MNTSQGLDVHLFRTKICEISGSQGGKYEDDSLLGYNAV